VPGVAIAVAGTATWSSVELTNVTGNVGPVKKLKPTISIGFPEPLGVKPVPFIVRLNAELPEATDEGIRLVIVSGAVVVLKLAYTSDSSVGDNFSEGVVPARSQLHPVNIHGEPPEFVEGVSVYVNVVPDR
jgi:hypothetical protein